METLGEYAYQAIHKHFCKVSKQEAAVLDREPEALHQMRVGLRRLRSALEVFSFALVLPKAASVKQARKIAAILGHVRDLDVLQETLCDEYYCQLPAAEQAQLMKLLKQLKRERQQQFKQVAKLLSSQSYAEFKAGFQNWLDYPSYQPAAELQITAVVADLMSPLVSQLLLHPAWLQGEATARVIDDLAQPPQRVRESSTEVLHDLRKQTKRVRYQAELFSPLYPPDFQVQIQNWADLQELLGKIHDQSVLEGHLTSLASGLPELTHLRLARQQQFWLQWQEIQPRYLDAHYRQELRRLVLYPQNAADPDCSLSRQSTTVALQPSL
jgi:CHAD domain-containing protein